MSIVWLASYPKSGNTWLRAVLTNYLRDSNSPASIDELIGGWPFALFDETVGLPSSDLTVREIRRLRPVFHELLAAELPHPHFVKVHDACVHTEAGPLFPRAATAGAVYLVRNPLDVAVSYAHHQQWSIDRTVARMNGSEPKPARHSTLPHLLFAEMILSWSANVSSWLESELPVHIVRYEDMLTNPTAAFGAVVRFVGLEWDDRRLAGAVDQARFERLQAQEEEQSGFLEKQPTAPSFFRAGTAGGWRTALRPRQVRALVDANAPLMERFGYLDDARTFLAAAGSADTSYPAPARP